MSFYSIKILFLVGVLQVVFGQVVAQEGKGAFGQLKKDASKDYYTNRKTWVDKKIQSLSEEERIGQLFMVAAYSNKSEGHNAYIEKLVSKYHIGGLIFMQGGPVRQAKLTNRYQAKAKIPLMIAMDAEWGLEMRLDSTIRYPRQMTLGAIKDNRYIYGMGQEVARQLKRIGGHINFAPVVDVNVNPANPVIGTRSFGENKYKVAEKGKAYMHGMQHNGVIANAKHFPGHGDTDKDSHKTLPVINHSMKRLKDIELYPFQQLIDDSLMSVMVAHIHVPSLDNRPNRATTLSNKVVNGLLKDSLKFKGLVFTDALDMKGVSKFYKAGEVNAEALIAGNDVLLFPMNVPEAVKAIKKAISQGKVTQKEIDKRVRKILEAKYFVGLDKYEPVKVKGIYEEINSPKALLVKNRLYEQAVTVVKNGKNILPIKDLATADIATVTIGIKYQNVFQNVLGSYAKCDRYNLPNKQAPSSSFKHILEKVKNKKTVIVGVYGNVNYRGSRYGISANTLDFLKTLERYTNVITVVFANPYSLKYFNHSQHLICGYDHDPMAQNAVAQLIFGAISNDARLPVTASSSLKENSGVSLSSLPFRIKYSCLPEQYGMKAMVLQKIDSVVEASIQQRIFPGCQVLIAHRGAVVFNKGYGYHTYNKRIPVNTETVYDVASVTKVCATTQAVMMLHSQGKINMNRKTGSYLPELIGTNKSNLDLKKVMSHQAGLTPFIPHYRYTMVNRNPSSNFYRKTPSKKYTIEINKKLYGINTLPDSVWQWTIDSDLRKRKYKRRGVYNYRYSDLGFYIMQKVVEKASGVSQDQFLYKELYRKMGMSTMTYNPHKNLRAALIPPTEKDKYFRHETVSGYVHDPGAAMYGGVAGHAGIFSNANDLFKIMQMNLWNGRYGEEQFFTASTMNYFNSRHFPKNRRGLGWDKPTRSGRSGPVTRYASSRTFGHTGFTGACVWADPVHDLVFIFLSNRVHPSASNRKINKEGIRGKLHTIAYKSMNVYIQEEDEL